MICGNLFMRWGMFVARLAQLPHDEQTMHLIGKLEALGTGHAEFAGRLA